MRAVALGGGGAKLTPGLYFVADSLPTALLLQHRCALKWAEHLLDLARELPGRRVQSGAGGYGWKKEVGEGERVEKDDK